MWAPGFESRGWHDSITDTATLPRFQDSPNGSAQCRASEKEPGTQSVRDDLKRRDRINHPPKDVIMMNDALYARRVFNAIHYARDRGVELSEQDMTRHHDYPMVNGMDATAWVDIMTQE